MAQTYVNDIVTVIDSKSGKKEIVHYTKNRIKEYIKEELVSAIEAGEKSPFMRLLHLRKGNLNAVKADCKDAILDRINEYVEESKTNKDVRVELNGGYESTIVEIVDTTFDGLMENINFAKKMIKENPVQIIELGLFKNFINQDKKVLMLLFVSLIESSSVNSQKLADKMFDKYISKDEELLMLMVKHETNKKYVENTLKKNPFDSNEKYAKFAKQAVKVNPDLLESIDMNLLKDADILAIIKMNILKTPSVIIYLSELKDQNNVKKYLKSAIRYSNEKMQEEYAKLLLIQDEEERKEKIADFKKEASSYLDDFKYMTTIVANYCVELDKEKLDAKEIQKNKEAREKHDKRVEKINYEYNAKKSSEDGRFQDTMIVQLGEAKDTITEEDTAEIFEKVLNDLGMKNLDKDETDTYKVLLKKRLEEIDKKYPKDKFPENNKQLKKDAARNTFKELLAGKVKTKLSQKLYNKSLAKRKTLVDKLSNERVEELINDRFLENIKEFEDKYNAEIQRLEKERISKLKASERQKEKQIAKNREAKAKKYAQADKEGEEILGSINEEFGV